MIRGIKPEKIRNILVMKLGGIGDILMITPALKSLRKLYPQAKISLMAEGPSSEIVRGSPWIDELIVFTELYRYRSFIKLLFNPRIQQQGYQLMKRLFRRRFDLFIEFHNIFYLRDTIKSILVGYFSRAPLRIGLNTDRRCYFLNIKVPDKRFIAEHITEKALRVVKTLGGDISERQTEVWISEEDRAYAKVFFSRYRLNQEKLVIGIHSGGNPFHLIRSTWPEERFSKVADILVEKYQARILLTGGPQDVEYVNHVASLMKTKPLILAGVTTVKQSAVIIERCHLFISNDTGPMHMAVTMRVPTIGIFGWSDWQMYGTYPPETNFIMLRKPIDCWPCRNFKCTSRKCSSLITVEDVLDAVEKQLKRR